MDGHWKKMFDALLDSLKDRAGKFLEENKDAEEFVKERLERLAKLGWAYLATTDDDVRARVERDIRVVRQTLENEASTIAVKAKAAAREAFLSVLMTVIGTFWRTLPAIAGAL